MVSSNVIAAITILAVVISFIGAIQVTFQQQIQTAVERVETNINGSNRNFGAIVTAIREIRELQQNITTTSDARGERFVRYLEAESEDTDEELDDLRNITLALADYHGMTIPNETREDHITFEGGIIIFDNGTKVGLGNIFGSNRR